MMLVSLLRLISPSVLKMSLVCYLVTWGTYDSIDDSYRYYRRLLLTIDPDDEKKIAFTSIFVFHLDGASRQGEHAKCGGLC